MSTDPRTQTEVDPSIVEAYVDPSPGAAFWVPHVDSSGVPPPAPPAGGLPEAPLDGQAYGRLNGAWAVVLEDAPSDGLMYVRQNGLWIARPEPGPWIPINFLLGTPSPNCSFRIEPGGLCRIKGTVVAQSGNWGTVSVLPLPLPAAGTVYFLEGGVDDTGNNTAAWQVMIWGAGAPTPGQLRLLRQLPDSGAGGTCSLDGIVYPV